MKGPYLLGSNPGAVALQTLTDSASAKFGALMGAGLLKGSPTSSLMIVCRLAQTNPFGFSIKPTRMEFNPRYSASLYLKATCDDALLGRSAPNRVVRSRFGGPSV